MAAEVAKIPLRGRDGAVRAWVTIDAELHGELGQHRWCLQVGRYAARRVGPGHRGRVVLMHREVLGLEPGDGLYGDHINGDTLDNRRSNLRIVTPQESAQNTCARPHTSKHRGVSWDRSRQRWAARVGLNGRNHFVGRFDDEDEAAEAAARWRVEHLPFAVAR